MGKRISLQCTYYFEVSKDYTDYIDTYAAGVYSAAGYMGAWYGGQSRLAMNSDRVWCQGPRGGVQLIKGAYWNYWATYLRRDSEKMKQFVWVKLRARQLNT